MTRYTIEIEPDDFAGFHALIVDDAGMVYFITDSYPSTEGASREACAWIDKNRWPATA